DFIRADSARFRRNGKWLGRPHGGDRQVKGESRAAGRKSFGLDASAVFTNDGQADAEPEAGASAGTLRGVERIKNPRKRFRADANTVVLDGDGELVAILAGRNLNATRITDL